MTLPPLTIDTVLRDVQVDDHRLILWETGRRDDMGKTILAYRLLTPEGKAIFEGADYCVGMATCIDSDEAVRGILSFLTLRPGDVDSDYFEKYTDAQRAWRDEHAEHLSLWSHGDDFFEGEDDDPFELPDHAGAFKVDSYREVPA